VKIMANEKYMFAAAVVIAIAFFGFLLLGSGSPGANSIGSHTIDAAAKPTYGPPAAQAGASASQPSASSPAAQPAIQAVQEVSLFAGPNGYDKERIVVKAGQPVHFSFTANGAGCCGYLIIDNVGVQLSSRGNTVDATFTPPVPGNYPYHCGMNMCRGVLVAE
jgi:plastocyanin